MRDDALIVVASMAFSRVSFSAQQNVGLADFQQGTCLLTARVPPTKQSACVSRSIKMHLVWLERRVVVVFGVQVERGRSVRELWLLLVTCCGETHGWRR